MGMRYLLVIAALSGCVGQPAEEPTPQASSVSADMANEPCCKTAPRVPYGNGIGVDRPAISGCAPCIDMTP